MKIAMLHWPTVGRVNALTQARVYTKLGGVFRTCVSLDYIGSGNDVHAYLLSSRVLTSTVIMDAMARYTSAYNHFGSSSEPKQRRPLERFTSRKYEGYSLQCTLALLSR